MYFPLGNKGAIVVYSYILFFVVGSRFWNNVNSIFVV